MTGEKTTIPLIRTKLQRPPIVGSHVHRSELLLRLDQRRQRPLTLVTAPAGYGKSTLLSCWLESCDIPVAWISLDENDNDLHLFLSYVLAAVRTIFPGVGKEIETILNGSELPPMSILAGCVINELDQISQLFTLALDDYHVIHNETIHLLVIEILKHPPRTLHLAIASRDDPPLPLTTMRAKGEMTEIQIQDLRFSHEETVKYLELMLEKKIDGHTIAMIEKKTEGWVTGLRLAALSLRHREDADELWSDFPNDSRYVMDYLAAEVLSQQPQTVQEYLLKTSILNRFSAPLCYAICVDETETEADEESDKKLLDRLIQANLFLIPLDDEHRWFRYHHLFQELLKSLLNRRLSPDDIDMLHRKAGVWFADKGFIEEALHHFLVGKDTQAAIRLVSRHRRDMINQEKWRRIERWLNMLPPSCINERPDFLITKAWLCENKAQYSEMIAYLKKFEALVAVEPPKTTTNWDYLTAEFNVLKAFGQYLNGDPKGVVFHAKLAIGNADPHALNVRGVAQTLLAGGYQMGGQLKKAYETLNSALKEEIPNGSAYYSQLFSALCFVHWIAADLTGLRQGAQQLLKHGENFDLQQSIAFGHYFLGILHYLRSELAEAESHLRLVSKERFTLDTVNSIHSTFALALSLQAQSHPEGASEALENLIGYAMESHNSDVLTISQAFQAELALRQGNIPKALKWVQNYDPHPFNPGHRFYIPQFTLVKVLLALNTKQSLEQSTELISRLYDYFASIHNTRFIIDVLALQAILYKAKGDDTNALSVLERAISLAEPGGFLRSFLDLGPEMAELLNRLGKLKTGVKYIGRLLVAFRKERSAGILSDAPLNRSGKTEIENGSDVMEKMTKRELEITTLLAQRLSNKEIANKLFISPKTVKTHLFNIYQKLKVSNRHEAAAKASTLGMI